jgi:hypothetical protein
MKGPSQLAQIAAAKRSRMCNEEEPGRRAVCSFEDGSAAVTLA